MRRFRPMFLALPLLALLCGTASAEIRDNGRLFSAETITKAKVTIADIEKHYRHRVVVETFAEVPSEKLAAFDLAGKDKAARAKFFRSWLEERAKASGATGIFILICKKPGYVEVETETKVQKHDFTINDTQELGSQLRSDFANHAFDEGLLTGIDFIANTMKAHQGIKTQPEVAKPSATPVVKTNHGEEGGGMGLMGMVIIIGGIVLAFWVISALIRALTGMGRGMAGGQPGGYMGGPGYGGGGGGGFMSTFMGGMFGSMAGNWMYNNMFGGGQSHHYDNPSYGGDGGAIGGGGDDGRFDGSASAGGDFGEDAGNSGGGGFFGGGDDAGGGGGFFGGGDAGGDFGGGGDGGGDF